MRKTVIAAAAVVVALIGGYALQPAQPVADWQVAPPAPIPPPSVVAAEPRRPAEVTFPVAGPRRYTVVPGTGRVVGSAGRVYSYRVAVERGIRGVEPGEFARFVEETYAHPSGWTAGGQRRFRRVDGGRPADFTVYLVTPATRDALCGDGYDRYTSCRSGDRVVVNVARWARGVPGYGASLETYRRYVVNHETGHRLGYGHELCPGPGAAAPVMQQQSLGRHGCAANPWPYRDGRAYHGRSGAYDDPVPPA